MNLEESAYTSKPESEDLQRQTQCAGCWKVFAGSCRLNWASCNYYSERIDKDRWIVSLKDEETNVLTNQRCFSCLGETPKWNRLLISHSKVVTWKLGLEVQTNEKVTWEERFEYFHCVLMWTEKQWKLEFQRDFDEENVPGFTIGYSSKPRRFDDHMRRRHLPGEVIWGCKVWLKSNSGLSGSQN